MDRVGYAYLAAAILQDWGVQNLRGHLPPSIRAGRVLIPILVQMLDRYAPTVLLVPDIRPGAVRRSVHVRQALESLVREAVRRGIAVYPISHQQVRAVVKPNRGGRPPNRRQINERIVGWFPELQPSLPKARRLWEPEQYFEPMFQAVAMYCGWQGLPNGKDG